MRPKISVLDEVTVAQIAAGEVIERPASIVKELVENSLDAGATQIHVHMEDGGLSLLSIQDNGFGIPKEELELAIQPHSTSKIHSFNDIYDVQSFGFRGEALSSICHVARLDLESKTDEQESGYRIQVEDKQCSEPEPVAMGTGTRMTVTRLFNRIPVRLKYLKSAKYESSQVINVLIPLLLIYPEIDIKCTHGDKVLLDSTGINDAQQLIVDYVDHKLAGHLIPVDTEYQGYGIQGFLSDPAIHFSNRTKQFTLVNRRLIKNPLLQKSIRQVYADLIPPGRFPFVLLNVSPPDRSVDVNVHPQKMDVSFANTQEIFSLVHRALKPVFRQGLNPESTGMTPLSAASVLAPMTQRTYSELEPHDPSPRLDLPVISASTPMYQASSLASSVSVNPLPEPVLSQESLLPKDEELAMDLASVEALSFFDAYWVIKWKGHCYIMDQHALHERILYEAFKQRDEAFSDQQPLLIPEIVKVTPAEYEAFEDLAPWLANQGFAVSDFGPLQLKVEAVPVHLSRCRISEWLSQVLGDLVESHGVQSQKLERTSELQMMACKAAIKAGDPLSHDEVLALLKQYLASPSNYTCPHGRALWVEYTRHDFESCFHRR